MSQLSTNNDEADDADDASFRTCDDDDVGDAPPKVESATVLQKSISWAARSSDSSGRAGHDPSGRRLTEDTLRTKNGTRALPPDGAEAEAGADDDAEGPHFSDEKDGDCKKLLSNDGRGENRQSVLLEGDNDLPLDSFTMLYVANTFREHCLPVAVFGLQMLILILIMINLLQTSDRPLATKMNVPVDVPLTVKISQYIACMVSVFTADDLVSGALYVGRRVVKKGFVEQARRASMASHEGYQRTSADRMRSMMRSISRANRSTGRHWKWELANSLRIVEGALVIVVSFIFIVQSPTALDLWLNFAAVQFVGMLDDSAYHLSLNRFLGSTARHLAIRVTDFEVYSEGERHKKKVRRLRLALFVGIGLAMWAGLSYFVYQQAELAYACSSLSVTVGEDKHQQARYFSGRYVILEKKINGRAVYVQEQGSGAFLAYCADDEINRWSISPLDNNEEPEDPCSKIVLQSERTKTHDISEVSDAQFWTGDSADANIKCNQCDPNRKGGDCSFRGTCDAETNLCDCDAGFFGDSCQLKGPCTELVGHDEFHGFYTRAYQKEWDLMYLDGTPVMVYDRPVYVLNMDSDVFDVILFDGGRWFVSQTDYFPDWYDTYGSREKAEKSFAKYLISSFNARSSKYIASYISDPSTLASPSNVPFRAWLSEAAEDSIGELGEEEYELLCADCDDGDSGISFCVGDWGEADYTLCKSTESDIHGTVNRCECRPGFSGPLCRIRPVQGTSSLHLDHGSDMCSTCFEDNPWVVWDLNGNTVQCSSMGKLLFEDSNGTFTRELALHLNASHFSVFVSSTDDSLESLCLVKEGTKEVYSVRRDETEERIHVNAAIHLDGRREFLGDVVRPEEVKCLASAEVDHDVCTTSTASLAQVYSNSDMKTSMLRNAWLMLDLKVTPHSGDYDESDSVAIPAEPTTATTQDVSPTVPSIEGSAAPPQNISSLATLPTTTSSEANPTESQSNTTLSDNKPASIASAISEQYTFAVIPKSSTNAFFLPVKDGCEERAAALSRPSVRGSILVNCLFVGPEGWNTTEQIEIAKNLVASGSVDGIAMSVIDEELTAPVIDSAVSAGISFITFDSDAPSTKRASYVGTDNVALGEEIGMLLLTRFATLGGTYAMISGFSENLFRRERGIRNVLNGNGWSEVAGPITIGADPIGQMRQLMQNHTDLTAILLTLGGVMRAGEPGDWESFVQEYPDLVILSADAMPVQIDLLNRGYVNGLVGQQPADMGSKSIDTLLSLSKGNEVEDFIATSLVVMGRVNKGNPYTQLELSSAAAPGSTATLPLIILAILALVALLM